MKAFRKQIYKNENAVALSLYCQSTVQCMNINENDLRSGSRSCAVELHYIAHLVGHDRFLLTNWIFLIQNRILISKAR